MGLQGWQRLLSLCSFLAFSSFPKRAKWLVRKWVWMQALALVQLHSRVNQAKRAFHAPGMLLSSWHC